MEVFRLSTTYLINNQPVGFNVHEMPYIEGMENVLQPGTYSTLELMGMLPYIMQKVDFYPSEYDISILGEMKSKDLNHEISVRTEIITKEKLADSKNFYEKTTNNFHMETDDIAARIFSQVPRLLFEPGMSELREIDPAFYQSISFDLASIIGEIKNQTCDAGKKSKD